MGETGLRFETIPAPLRLGVNTRDDEKNLPVGKLVDMINLEINRLDGPRCRRGVERVAPTPGAPPSGGKGDSRLTGIVAHDRTPVVYGERRLWAWDDAAEMARYRGRAPGPAVSSRVVQTNMFTSLCQPDCAALDDVLVVASVEVPNQEVAGYAWGFYRWVVRVDVFRESTDEQIASWTFEQHSWPTFVARPVVVASKGTIYVTWFGFLETGVGSTDVYINAIAIDPATVDRDPPTVFWTSTPNGAATGLLVADACAWNDGSHDSALAAVPSDDGNVKLYEVAGTPTSGTITLRNTVALPARTSIALAPDTSDAGSFLLLGADDAVMKALYLVGTTPTSSAVTVVSSVTKHFTRIGAVCTELTNATIGAGTDFVVAYEWVDNTSATVPNQTCIVESVVVTSLLAIGTPKGLPWLSLMSRPFMRDGSAYAVVTEQRGRSYYLADLCYVNSTDEDPEPLEAVSIVSPLEAGGRHGAQWWLSDAFSSGQSRWSEQFRHLSSVTPGFRIALPRSLQVISTPNDGSDVSAYVDPVVNSRTGTQVTTFDFDAAKNAVSIGRACYAAGGQAVSVTPKRACEVGFLWEPYRVTAAQGGAGNIEAGVYSYRVCYEWADGAGNVERSAPSSPVTVDTRTSGAPTEIELTWVPLTLTAKQTLAIPERELCAVVYRTANLGETYYRVGAVKIDRTFWFATPFGRMSFTDNLADEDLTSRAQLYTSQSIVPHFPPPSGRCVFEHQGRLGVAGCEDPTRVYLSLYLTPGEAAAFSPETHYLQFPEAIVAARSMDGILYAFSRTGILFVAGDGPDDSGANNTWTQPQRLMSDVGCIDPRSLIETPAGLMFMSERGMYLLNRARTVEYIGSDAEGLFDGQTITSAVLCQDRRHVRFTRATGGWLSMFYEYGQWGEARHARYDGGLLRATSACTIGTRYWMAATDGIYRETDTYADADGSPIVWTLKTGFVHVGALTGYQAVPWVHVLGDVVSPHNLTVTVVNDYRNIGTPETRTFTDNQKGTVGVHLATQKGGGVQVTVSCTPTTAGRGFDPNALAFEIGFLRGTRPLAPAARK